MLKNIPKVHVPASVGHVLLLSWYADIGHFEKFCKPLHVLVDGRHGEELEFRCAAYTSIKVP